MTIDLVPDGVIITPGGFLHAACEGELFCGNSVCLNWNVARFFPLLDVLDPRDVERVAVWADKTGYGWWTGWPSVCGDCLRRVLPACVSLDDKERS